MEKSLSFLNPVIILAFIIFFSATGYILEWATGLSSWIIMAVSAVISLALTTVLHVFVLVPLASAEESLGYTEESLVGRVGKLIISIPENGFGEIFIQSKSGIISKPAASYEQRAIQEGRRVLVLETRQGVLYVVPYEDDLDAPESGT
ncbi:hypothetical protein RWE15_19770 [Virgibacillus halophilus]|uniref:Membrane protein NfeD2 N-terminal transmembrane domain-containing protein n=1 Tax=Tigheibacillus halophilus TaxID=361280 RepID=A0ABU5CA28_9BACI|nr:hypothetical protein [Virgibacillus halophilus]